MTEGYIGILEWGTSDMDKCGCMHYRAWDREPWDELCDFHAGVGPLDYSKMRQVVGPRIFDVVYPAGTSDGT